MTFNNTKIHMHSTFYYSTVCHFKILETTEILINWKMNKPIYLLNGVLRNSCNKGIGRAI
jgi:hypothetical protein